jgi:hypothetical protein
MRKCSMTGKVILASLARYVPPEKGITALSTSRRSDSLALWLIGPL